MATPKKQKNIAAATNAGTPEKDADTPAQRERDRIQREVNKLLAFSTAEDWGDFLRKKGEGHKFYYHYTTLKTLKAIFTSSAWKLKRADLSNDPLENPVHNTSFVSRSLSSMGMWEMYSKLSADDDIGVRIGIPQKEFREIFAADSVFYAMDPNGNLQPFGSNTPVICDMAYWHFGKDTGSSLAFYRNYEFPGNALSFHFENEDQMQQIGKKLPPFFKTAVWRKEDEVRVYADFSNERNVPDELFVKIKPEHFKKMSFRLSPAVKNSKKMAEILKKQEMAEVLFFLMFKLLCNELKVSQFQIPNQYEAWQG